MNNTYSNTKKNIFWYIGKKHCKPVLTAKEAAEYFGYTERMFLVVSKCLSIPSVNNKNELYNKLDLDDWLRENKIINPNWLIQFTDFPN